MNHELNADLCWLTMFIGSPSLVPSESSDSMGLPPLSPWCSCDVLRSATVLVPYLDAWGAMGSLGEPRGAFLVGSFEGRKHG